MCIRDSSNATYQKKIYKDWRQQIVLIACSPPCESNSICNTHKIHSSAYSPALGGPHKGALWVVTEIGWPPSVGCTQKWGQMTEYNDRVSHLGLYITETQSLK